MSSYELFKSRETHIQQYLPQESEPFEHDHSCVII